MRLPQACILQREPPCGPSAVTHWLGDVLSSRTGWVSLWEGLRTGLWNSFPVSYPSLWGSEAKPLNLFFFSNDTWQEPELFYVSCLEKMEMCGQRPLSAFLHSAMVHARAHAHMQARTRTHRFFWFPSPSPSPSPQEWLLWLGLPRARFASALMPDVQTSIPPPRRQALRPVPVPGTFLVL